MKSLMRQAVEMTENNMTHDELEQLDRLYRTHFETQKAIQDWKKRVFTHLIEEDGCYINEEDIDLYMDYRKALWYDEANIRLTWK